MTLSVKEWRFEAGGNNPAAWVAAAKTLRGAADAIRNEVERTAPDVSSSEFMVDLYGPRALLSGTQLSVSMIHQPKLIVGIGFPRSVDFDRTRRLTAGALRRSAVMQRYSLLNSSTALNGELPVKKPMVAFSPPPGSSPRRVS